MASAPIRLAIASPDAAVVDGLRVLLGPLEHRIVVVDGAADVVLHDAADAEDLTKALRRTGAVAWVPLRGVAEHIASLVETAASSSDTQPDSAGLSDREAQVLALIAQGLSNQEIADRVFVSINSVKTYIRSAYRKIGVTSRSQAVAWCLRHHVTGPDS